MVPEYGGLVDVQDATRW